MAAFGAGLLIALLLPPALAQPVGAGAEGAPEAACSPPAGRPAVDVRPATYVALGRETLLRLLVERSVDTAQLIVNRVDGNRLYDRRYWKPVRVVERCGERTIDYVDEEAGAEAPRLRLLLKVPEEIRRSGLPRPLMVIPAELQPGSAESQALQFEEVVIKREVGADPRKK